MCNVQEPQWPMSDPQSTMRGCVGGGANAATAAYYLWKQ